MPSPLSHHPNFAVNTLLAVSTLPSARCHQHVAINILLAMPRFGLVPLLSPPFCCLSLRATSLSQENATLLAAGEEESALADIEHAFALEDIAGDLDGVFEEPSDPKVSGHHPNFAINTLLAVSTLPSARCHQHVAISILLAMHTLPSTRLGRNIHTRTVALDVAAHLQHHAAACPPL